MPLIHTVPLFLAGSGALLTALGPGLAHVRALAPLTGFSVMLVGVVLAFAALLLGIITLVWSKIAARRPSRRKALAACGMASINLLLLGAFAGKNLLLPPINDATTDPDDAPAFAVLAQQAENRGRDMSYPIGFAERQRQAYPDLVPLVVDSSQHAVFARAVRVANELGWSVIAVNEAAGLLEATAQTRVFRFTDDIVVRVRARPAGSRVDVRSKSRDGKGDWGENARRIRAFYAAMAAAK